MTGSVNGKVGLLHAPYAASKHGVLGLMRTLEIEAALFALGLFAPA